MLIKKSTIKTAIAITALSASSVVFAVSTNNDSGFVAGLQGGYASFNADDATSWDLSQSGFSGRTYLGYDFNKYFGLETGYTFLPNIEYTPAENNFSNYSQTSKSYAIDVVAKGSIPITDQFNVFGKLGTAYMSTKTNGEGNGISISGSTSSTTLAFGAGAEYKITPNVGVDVSWTRYNGKGNQDDWRSAYIPSADVFLLGVSYKFGNRT